MEVSKFWQIRKFCFNCPIMEDRSNNNNLYHKKLQFQTPAARSFDFSITCMITGRIGLHLVLLPLFIQAKFMTSENRRQLLQK